MEKSSNILVSRETLSTDTFLSLFGSDSYVNRFFELLPRKRLIAYNTNNISYLLFLVSLLIRKKYFPVVLFDKESDAELFLGDLRGLNRGNGIKWIPSFGQSSDLFASRAFENHLSDFLSSFYSGGSQALVSGPDILDYPVRDRSDYENSVLSICVGSEPGFSRFCDSLISLGYERTSGVEFVGEFCIRGGIVDVYPYGETYPYRVEFFGDSVESIRHFNPYDQRSFKDEQDLTARPVSHADGEKKALGRVLPENTIIFSLNGYADSLRASCDYPIVDFSGTTVLPDISAPILDVKVPDNPSDTSFYSRIGTAYKSVFVFADYDVVLANIHRKSSANYRFVHAGIPEGFFLGSSSMAVLSGRKIFRKEHSYNPNKNFIPERTGRVSAVDHLRYGQPVVHVDYGIGIYRGIEMVGQGHIRQECVVLEYEGKDRLLVPVRHMNRIYKYSSADRPNIRPDKIGSGRWERARNATQAYLKKSAYDLLSIYRDRKRNPGFSFDKDSPDTLELESSFPFNETRDQLKALKDTKKDMEKSVIMDRLICGDVGFGKTEVAIRAAFKAVYSGKQVSVLTPTTILCYQHYENFKERLAPFGIRVDYLNRFKNTTQSNKIFRDVAAGKIDILIGTHRLLSDRCSFYDLGLLVIDEEHRFGVNHKEKIKNFKRRVDVLTLTATPIPRTLQLSLAGLRDITKIETPPRERLPIDTNILFWDEQKIKTALIREFDRNGQAFVLHNRIDELPGLTEKFKSLFPNKRIRYAHGQMSGKKLEKDLLGFYHHEFDILVCTTIIESGIDIPNANTLVVMDAHRFGLSQLYQIRGRIGRSYRKAYAYLVVPRSESLSAVALKRLQTLEYYTDLGSGYEIAMRDLEIRGFGNLLGVEQSGHINRVGYEYFQKLFSDVVMSLKQSKTCKSRPSFKTDVMLNDEAYFPSEYINSKDIRIAFYKEISSILDSPISAEMMKKRLTTVAEQCRDRFGPIPEKALNLFRNAFLSVFAGEYFISSVLRSNNKIKLIFSADVPIIDIQAKAKQLVALSNKKNRNIRFVSKKQLVAEIDFAFVYDMVPDKYLSH